MFVRTAVTRIERERLLIMRECRFQLPQAAIGVSDIILDIGILRVTQGRKFERRDGPIPIASA